MNDATTAVRADGRYLAAPSYFSRVTEPARVEWHSRSRGAHGA